MVGSSAVKLKMLTPVGRMSLACPGEPGAAPQPTGSSQSRGSCPQGGAKCQAAPEPASQQNVERHHVFSGPHPDSLRAPETHGWTGGPRTRGAVFVASKVEQDATEHETARWPQEGHRTVMLRAAPRKQAPHAKPHAGVSAVVQLNASFNCTL